MRKINETDSNGKSVSDAARNAFNSNLFDSLGGDSNGLFVSDYAEKPVNLQCHLCCPPLSQNTAQSVVCASCREKSAQIKESLLENFQRHKKIVKLDSLCFCCDKRKTAAMMAKSLPICRRCLADLKAKGETAQNNFISRATNNFLRGLKKAVTL